MSYSPSLSWSRRICEFCGLHNLLMHASTHATRLPDSSSGLRMQGAASVAQFPSNLRASPRLHQALLTLCPQALICMYVCMYVCIYIYLYIYIYIYAAPCSLLVHAPPMRARAHTHTCIHDVEELKRLGDREVVALEQVAEAGSEFKVGPRHVHAARSRAHHLDVGQNVVFCGHTHVGQEPVRRLLVSHARCHMLSPGHAVTRRRHNLYNCCL